MTDSVRWQLRALKLSQGDLAQLIGLSHASMSRRMNCAVEWTLSDLERLNDLGFTIPAPLTTTKGQ